MTQPRAVATGPRHPRLVSRSGVVRWLLGSLVIAVTVLVVVLLVGGGAPQPVPSGLPDPGVLTGWALPVSRLVADLCGIAMIGLLLSAGVLVPSPEHRLARTSRLGVRLAARAAALWFLAVLVEIVFTVSDILGSPVPALSPTVVYSFVTSIPQGRALTIQALMIAVVAGCALFVLTTKGATVAAAGASLALVPPALTGHSASSGSHELAVASLLVHVLAASVWVGGLAALLWASCTGASLRFALGRFSTLAAWCFVTVAVSGVVNAGVRLGTLSAVVGSSYGLLVLAKVAALIVLGGFGWSHRRRTVAQLEAASDPPTHSPAWTFLRIAAAEVTVMAATVGLAVGLSRSPTPVGTEADTSYVTELLGFPLPPPPTVGRLLLGWTPDGFAITFVVFAALLYAVGVRALRRHGVRWPARRIVSWYLALLLTGWATVGGLGLYAHVLFSAHLAEHMLLTTAASVGLVLGAPVTLALRALPGPRTDDELGLRQMLGVALRSRTVRACAHPVTATLLWVGSPFVVYLSGLFPSLMSNHLGHSAMSVWFLTTGCLFFWVMLAADPTPTRWRPLPRVTLLLLTAPVHALLATLLMTGQTVLARGYFLSMARPYTTDYARDQHLGGLLALVISELTIAVVTGLILLQARAEGSRSEGSGSEGSASVTRAATGNVTQSAP